MKQYWQRIELKINALSLRERTITFAMAAVVLVVMVNILLLDPELAKQKNLTQQITEQQQQIMAMQSEIQLRVKSREADPDLASRMTLQKLRQQAAQMRGELLGMQKGLVSPDKMASMLEDILKRNGKLHLVSLKNMPATPINESTQPDMKNNGEKSMATATSPKDKTEGKPVTESVYKHAVEISVQGSYFDIMNYLAALESLPWQLFWGNAQLKVEEYPNTSLTLTLFTLSLDKKWLNI